MPAANVTVALVGNPNAGKSTLFNALSGLRQHVGNYPGVTVEMKKGRFTHGGTEFALIDLPGTYSLAPRSPDEMVAVDLLLGRRPEEPRPDVILSIVDASNLDRHLYLTTQLMELGVPVVVAVNMVDVAEAQGVRIDAIALARQLGVRVVPIQANRGVGLDALRGALKAATGDKAPAGGPKLPDAVEEEVGGLGAQLRGEVPPFLARRLLLDVGGQTEEWLVRKHGPALRRRLDEARTRLTAAGCPVPAVEARTRYGWIKSATKEAVARPAVRPVTWTDRIDRFLTHRVWGTLVFLTVMFLIFQAIFVGAEYLMAPIERAFAATGDAVTEALPPGPVRGLMVDGAISGVGGVLVFLPQILLLFLFIAVLEDCGYMARAAFVMDRLMSRCGLSGKSFIPLLSSVACAVPGVMATRVIEDRRDRLATILVAPLMSCSARLPVYALLIGAFLTEGFAWWVPGATLFGMYLIGFIVAPVVALVLKRTLLRGGTPLFVMELPAYKRPSLRVVLRRMADAGWAFVRRAGTLILASMVVVWALLYFPHTDGQGRPYEERVAAAADEAAANHVRGEWKRQSYLGRAGRALEPAFAPLGWDWRIGMAALASFPAREVVVGTLGIIYDQGDKAEEESLRGAIRGQWAGDPVRSRYPVAVALSVMVFFALCCQCASTLAVIRRETRSWAWPAFTFAYMTALAYVGALATFQIGRAVTDLMS
ncbi:MAG TPA: ferrous iron transport protein B [Fimbriiglobus sp.]|nr:ferrous iron transport protein B [Fimbriiglobus sp.]